MTSREVDDERKCIHFPSNSKYGFESTIVWLKEIEMWYCSICKKYLYDEVHDNMETEQIMSDEITEVELATALDAITHAKKEGNYYIVKQGYWDEIVFVIRKLKEITDSE